MLSGVSITKIQPCIDKYALTKMGKILLINYTTNITNKGATGSGSGFNFIKLILLKQRDFGRIRFDLFLHYSLTNVVIQYQNINYFDFCVERK